MNTDHISQPTQSHTTPLKDPNTQFSKQLQLIQEIEEESQLPPKPRPRLSLDSDRESLSNQWIKQRPGSSSPSDQKTIKNYTNRSGSQALNSGYCRSSRTPQDFQEEIIPQVRSILKKNTFTSHPSQQRSKQIKPSRGQSLHSLQCSSKKNRIYPEEQLNNNNDSIQSEESFFEETDMDKEVDQTRYRFDNRYLHLRFMIYPDDPLKIAWDILIVIALLYVCFLVPYQIAFQDEEETITEFILGVIIDIFYGIDIILNMISAYVDDQDELIIDRQIILKHYISTWFILDLICVIPFDYILVNFNQSNVKTAYNTIKLIKIGRLLKFLIQKKKYGELLNSLSNISQNIRVMIISLISVIVVSHFFSCFWYFIGNVSQDSTTWVHKYVDEQSNFEKYILSMYWVFQTMATTGYGDISSTNSTEQLVAIIIMIIGVIFFSVTIGSVSSLLTQLDTQNLKYKEKIDTLNEIAKNHKIDNTLYSKICKVLKQGYKNNQNEVVEFLHLLPQNLRTELSQAMYKNVFLGIDLFKQKPLRFTAYIGPLLTIIRIPEGDVIYNEGDYASEIYFIREGTVSFCIKECDYQPFVTINTGQYFGEIELIKETQRKYTAIAQKPCELLSLSKSNFFKIFFSEFREIGEELHEESRQKKRNYEALFTKTKAYLQGLEQKAEQLIEENDKPKQKLGLERFKLNLICQAQTKQGFLQRAIKEVEQQTSNELKRKMSRLKTVLLQKGVINKIDENSPKRISPRFQEGRNFEKRNTFLPIIQQEIDHKESNVRLNKKAMTTFVEDHHSENEQDQKLTDYDTNILFLRNLKNKKMQLYL